MSGWNKKLEGIQSNIDETVHALEFSTSQEAWEKLNEAFIRLEPTIFERGATANMGLAISYNMFIKVRRAWVDPDFNYGRCFNYKETKWTSLLNNYLDFNKLDLLRSRLRNLSGQNYNITYTFNNHHDNGKQCLIAATFSKRFGEDIPVVTVIMRSSEITKRLIFDLLLVQRIGEYIYGEDQAMSMNIFASQMYGNIETLIMYDTHKPLKKVLKKVKNAFTDRIMEVYNKFMKGTEKEFSSFKVFFRSFKVLRPDLYKDTYQDLFAKQLLLKYDEDIPYPEDCISFSQRKKFKKQYLNHSKK